jgi:hypothetical protein
VDGIIDHADDGQEVDYCEVADHEGTEVVLAEEVGELMHVAANIQMIITSYQPSHTYSIFALQQSGGNKYSLKPSSARARPRSGTALEKKWRNSMAMRCLSTKL